MAKKEGRVGKLLATIGVASIAISVIGGLVLGISGATLHNVLQLGGLALAVVGFVLWRWVKV